MLIKNRDKELEERSNLQKIQADKMAEIHEKNQSKFNLQQ